MYKTNISTHPLQTLHFLKVPENSLEMLKVLENNLKSLKVLENNLESLKLQENRLVPENSLEVLKVMENKFDLLKVLENNLKLLKVFPYGLVPLKTYLRVGDIDLTVIGDENIPFPGRVVDLLEIEKENENAEFKIQDIMSSHAEDEAVDAWYRSQTPTSVDLCPTRELCEQVFGVAKSISHHARFWSTMVSGGGRIRPQEEALNSPIGMVLDEADMMFDRGFGPDIRKFLAPLNNRALKADGLGFQTVLVTATMTNGIQKLVDEEFQGIEHIRTPTLHKKVAAARHDFIKLSGAKNKLEALLQVVFEPKFKSNDGDCPTLVCIVCTDLAARGLDLNVHQKWIEGGNYELCIEDVRDEIWDMVKPADPLRITLSDLLSCKLGGTVASMLIDVLGSWAMTTEKTFYKKRKNQKKNKFCGL
ncbi:DEAD-box ATP-dependent RNA helicase 39 [Tanacetum coccineum]